MKKVMLALLIITAASYISCKKEGDTAGELYGKWKLTEQLSDPGDGSGKYQKVNGSPKYLTIRKTGEIEGEAMPEIVSYKILDSVNLEITSKNHDQPFIYRYKVTSKTLTLNPPCIEGCGYRFIRE